MLLLISAVILSGAAGELLANGGFDDGLEGWPAGNLAPEVRTDAVTEGGRTGGRITVPPGGQVGFPHISQSIAVKPDAVLEARVDAMSRGVGGGYGVYASLEFVDAGGKRISFAMSDAAHRENEWTPLAIRAVAPPGTATARLCLLLNGTGEGYFDNASLVRAGHLSVTPLDGPVTVTVTGEVVCRELKGFGAEDDGWFYNEENAAHGVDEDDIALREARIRWMDPDWVRMFFWHKDWCPSGDWETFTFDSPNMRSHYRTLDLYQEIGACVNVVGVEWGMPHPYADLSKVAGAIGALFERLIREKGYTCVKEWTLTNEPNGVWPRRGNTFDDFVQLHRLVKQEFTRRALSVRILGSDDTNGLAWFRNCVRDRAYCDTVDLFGSHRYFAYADRALATFFYDDRLGLLDGRKPFIVAEFGFQDERSGVVDNPLMEEYRYAVWTAAFVIEGLNRGVAGFSIWCLHEVYYPGNTFMNYGLWNFKNRDWQVRPAYHSFANFTRLTEAGDEVTECKSSSPQHVLAAKVGSTLFWVNRSDQTAEVRIEGFRPDEVRVMTEDTLSGDRECGTLLKLEENEFEVPPQSFGYAQ